MGLFAQLEKLHRQDRFQQEDFHTEIVAQVLRNSRQLTLQWLRGIGATTLSNPDSITIETQEEFARLEGQTTDSRPDIVIRVVQNAKTELILIESKLGSKQGPDQLQRYAEHLTARELENTALVFITRDYEGAADPIRLDRRFKLARGFEFYRYLKAYGEKDALTEELKLFMEENHMSLGNQFRAVDVVALENFLGVRALMDETLAGEVTLEAKKILGDVTSLKGSFKQLRDYKRYTIQAGFGNRDFYCLIGYWLPNRNPDDPVWAGVVLTSDPKSKIRSQVIAAFRSLVKDKSRGWSADGIDDEKAWCELSNRKPLNAFLSQEDHVRAIKSHFIGLLHEVRAFKKSNPRLPWSASAEEIED